jgi:hypothetical protein
MDEVVIGPQPLPAAEIYATVERVQAADQFDPTRAEEHDGRPVAEQPAS